MRRVFLILGACLAMSLVFAQVALAQEDGAAYTARGATTVPLNPDGTCPEGFVRVNAPLCAEESPNTPGRIFGYGEGDLATQPSAPAATPAPQVLPSSGGPSLLLPAAGMLLVTGLIGLGLVRRS